MINFPGYFWKKKWVRYFICGKLSKVYLLLLSLPNSHYKLSEILAVDRQGHHKVCPSMENKLHFPKFQFCHRKGCIRVERKENKATTSEWDFINECATVCCKQTCTESNKAAPALWWWTHLASRVRLVNSTVWRSFLFIWNLSILSPIS